MIQDDFRHFYSGSPLASIDHEIAMWFHLHLSSNLGEWMLWLSSAGSALWIAIVLSLAVAFLAWKKHWYGLLSVVLMVPGGMLLNSAIKILVHRRRPFTTGRFALWDGYSFPSGHTIGATLLYGMLLLAVVRVIQKKRWKLLAAVISVGMVALVGFSRIALGAHYLTDVLGAIALGSVWLVVCQLIVAMVRRLAGHDQPLEGPCRITPEEPISQRLAA